ncbi:MAG: PA2779 family protein [Burkholderiales bacterium]
MKKTTRLFTLSLALCVSTMGMMQSAQAALISTDAVARVTSPAVAQQDVQAARTHVIDTLQRADVAEALADRGVNLEQARTRVAAMTDDEALAVSQQIDSAPAGASDIIGTIVFIFLILLVTDVLGLTKVFPFTRSVR